MSSLYKRNGVYQIQYFENGKPVQKSLKTKSKADALEAQKEIDRRLGVFVEVREEQHGVAKVGELVDAYLDHAKCHYVKEGETTSTVRHVERVVESFEPYREIPTTEFGPRKLRAMMDRWVADGCGRVTTNKYRGIVVAAFKWAVSEEYCPETTWRALTAVPGVPANRHPELEREPVKPVPEAHIAKAKEKLSSVVQAIIDLQLATAARPGEILALRPRDIDRSGPVWIANLKRHKTAHRGKERILYFGPNAQAILKPFLMRRPEQYLFSPRESLAEYYGKRKTHRKPGWKDKERKSARIVGDRFSTVTYRRAVVNACDAAGVPQWHPNQLRHNAATRIRDEYGLEMAQIILGHSKIDMTQVYAEINRRKAEEVATNLG